MKEKQTDRKTDKQTYRQIDRDRDAQGEMEFGRWSPNPRIHIGWRGIDWVGSGRIGERGTCKPIRTYILIRSGEGRSGIDAESEVRQTDRQTHRQIHRQTYRQIHTDRPTDR